MTFPGATFPGVTPVLAPFLLAAMTALASGQHSSRPAVLPLDSLAWISGHWLSRDDGARHEGIWMEPSAGSMLGVFRTSEGAKSVRHVLFLMEQSSAGPVLSRRVFGPSLSPAGDAEQWTRLRLREVSGMRARFSDSAVPTTFSCTIELTAEDRLRLTVERTSAGQHATSVIEFSRQQPWPPETPNPAGGGIRSDTTRESCQ